MNFHTDDFGYNETNDKYLLQLLDDGKLQGVSVLSTMVTRQRLQELADLRRIKKFQVGLHFNIIEGKSMSKPEHIQSIVSHKGTFFPLYHLWMNIMRGAVRDTDVATEMDTQLKFLLDHGLPVTVLDSHQHTHALSPVAEVMHAIAQKHHIEDIRCYGNVAIYSPMARLKYSILRSMAFLTHLASADEFSLPVSWAGKGHSYSFMSWESAGFDIMKKDTNAVWYVVHPDLGYDTNLSYNHYFKTA